MQMNVIMNRYVEFSYNEVDEMGMVLI